MLLQAFSGVQGLTHGKTLHDNKQETSFIPVCIVTIFTW